MSAFEFPEYLRAIQETLHAVVAAGHVASVQFQADQGSATKGFLAGILVFADGTELHFREYVNLALAEPRQMYSYHYQNAGGRMIFRYDNAIHRPRLPVREHKHVEKGIVAAAPPPFKQVIEEILNLHSS